MTGSVPQAGDTRASPDLGLINKELNSIGDPCSVANGTPLGLVDMGIIGEIQLSEDGSVVVPLRLTSPSCYVVGYFLEEIVTRLSKIPGVSGVDVRPDLGLDWSPELMTAKAKEQRRESLKRRGMLPVVGVHQAQS